MLSVKNILAGLLLMVYGISFGHSVIPQHHHLNEHGEHVEEAHCEDGNQTHEHIAHDNHYDEGILDFLSCLVENLHQELPADHHSCERTTTSSQKVASSQVVISSIEAVEVPVLAIPVIQSFEIFTLFVDCQNDGYLTSHHLRRGPPNA